jgi:hypothetical protein
MAKYKYGAFQQLGHIDMTETSSTVLRMYHLVLHIHVSGYSYQNLGVNMVP